MMSKVKTKHGSAWLFYDSKDAPIVYDAMDRWIRGNVLALIEWYLETGFLKFAPGVNPADLWADITDNNPQIIGFKLLQQEDAAEFVDAPRTSYLWPAVTVGADGYDVAAAFKDYLKGGEGNARQKNV